MSQLTTSPICQTESIWQHKTKSELRYWMIGEAVGLGHRLGNKLLVVVSDEHGDLSAFEYHDFISSYEPVEVQCDNSLSA